MATKKTAQAVTMDILSGETRLVDFVKPILQTFALMEAVKADAKSDKTAKAYLERVEQQYRQQLKFLYEAANEAFPEDGVEPGHALSSLGPSAILDKYNFRVIVERK